MPLAVLAQYPLSQALLMAGLNRYNLFSHVPMESILVNTSLHAGPLVRYIAAPVLKHLYAVLAGWLVNDLRNNVRARLGLPPMAASTRGMLSVQPGVPRSAFICGASWELVSTTRGAVKPGNSHSRYCWRVICNYTLHRTGTVQWVTATAHDGLHCQVQCACISQHQQPGCPAVQHLLQNCKRPLPANWHIVGPMGVDYSQPGSFPPSLGSKDAAVQKFLEEAQGRAAQVPHSVSHTSAVPNSLHLVTLASPADPASGSHSILVQLHPEVDGHGWPRPP